MPLQRATLGSRGAGHRLLGRERENVNNAQVMAVGSRQERLPISKVSCTQAQRLSRGDHYYPPSQLLTLPIPEQVELRYHFGSRVKEFESLQHLLLDPPGTGGLSRHFHFVQKLLAGFEQLGEPRRQ